MYPTESSVQGLAKFFTKKHFNLSEQAKIFKENPALYQRLKQEGAALDRKLDERVIEIDRQIARLQDERQQLSGARSPQSKKNQSTLYRW